MFARPHTPVEPAMRNNLRQAFTLVELLVVVTIIVALLALLMPAMDRAVYEAELAVCGADQKSVVSGVQIYAASNRRFYPHYRAGTPNTANPEDSRYAPPIVNYKNGYDWRPVLAPLFKLNDALVCPLAPVQIDIENSRQTTLTFSTANLWFGFDYIYNDGDASNVNMERFKGMFKIGDRLTWEQRTGLPDRIGVRRFNTLTSDRDLYLISFGNLRFRGTSHPDRDGRFTPGYSQDGQGVAPETPASAEQTHAGWGVTLPKQQTDTLAADTNHGFDDGSVRTFREVGYEDDRMGRVPWLQTSRTGEGSFLQIGEY